MRITRRSMLTGIEHTMDLDITWAHVQAWQDGALIQNAMPHLTASQREFLISGTVDSEWETLRNEEGE